MMQFIMLTVLGGNLFVESVHTTESCWVVFSYGAINQYGTVMSTSWEE